MTEKAMAKMSMTDQILYRIFMEYCYKYKKAGEYVMQRPYFHEFVAEVDDEWEDVEIDKIYDKQIAIQKDFSAAKLGKFLWQ